MCLALSSPRLPQAARRYEQARPQGPRPLRSRSSWGRPSTALRPWSGSISPRCCPRQQRPPSTPATSSEAIDLGLRAARTSSPACDPMREGQGLASAARSVFDTAAAGTTSPTLSGRALALLLPSPPSSARAEALTNAALGHHRANRLVEATEPARKKRSPLPVAEVLVIDALVYAATLARRRAPALAGGTGGNSSARGTTCLSEAERLPSAS